MDISFSCRVSSWICAPGKISKGNFRYKIFLAKRRGVSTLLQLFKITVKSFMAFARLPTLTDSIPPHPASPYCSIEISFAVCLFQRHLYHLTLHHSAISMALLLSSFLSSLPIGCPFPSNLASSFGCFPYNLILPLYLFVCFCLWHVFVLLCIFAFSLDINCCFYVTL